jgi:poly(3-hydroxybutyrate) depolymerase
MQLPKPVRVVTLALLAGAFAVSCSPAGTGGGASPGSGGSGGRASGSGGNGEGGRAGSGGSTSGSGGSGGSTSGSGGSSTGSGGSGTGGSASGGSSGSGGSTAGGGAGGSSADAATEAAPAETGGGDASGGPGWAGIPGIEDLSTVKKSEGCGMDPGQALGSWVPFNVMITPKPVKGMGNRSYFIKLPANYDRNKAYRVIFVVPGCGGRGDNMFDFTTAAGTDGVIQIGMNPDPMAFSYAGCFDDFATASVEPQYFETLLGIANKKLCFDQHRVFFTGHSSGSFVSNMMGCIYGSTKVRAVAPSSGGLADNSMGMNMAPPCKPLPTPGIWSHNEDDNGNLIVWTQKAITRALTANKCQGTFATAPRMPYPGHPTCEKFMSCPAEFPIVFCHPRTGGHEGNKDVQPARSWEFFKSF